VAGAEPRPDHVFLYDPLAYPLSEYSPEPVIFAEAGESTAFFNIFKTVNSP